MARTETVGAVATLRCSPPRGAAGSHRRTDLSSEDVEVVATARVGDVRNAPSIVTSVLAMGVRPRFRKRG